MTLSNSDANAIKKMANSRCVSDYDESFAGSSSLPAQPYWFTYKGVAVFGYEEENLAAVPSNGRKNAKTFLIINLAKGEEVCQLSKKEVTPWLLKATK